MAASVRIDDSAFTDPRIKRLGRLLGTGQYDALGRMAHVWRYCADRQVYAVSAMALADLTDRDDFADHLLTSDLGEPDGDLIRIRGLEGRIEWLADMRAKAVAGGRARAKKAVRDSNGRLLSSQSPAGSPAGYPAGSQPAAGGAGPASQPKPSLSSSSSSSFKKELREAPTGPAPTLELALSPVEPPEPSPVTLIRDRYTELYRQQAGSNPGWGAKEAANAKKLVGRAGAAETLRRLGRMYRAPPAWMTPPFTFGAFVAAFDALAETRAVEPRGPSVEDVRRTMLGEG